MRLLSVPQSGDCKRSQRGSRCHRRLLQIHPVHHPDRCCSPRRWSGPRPLASSTAPQTREAGRPGTTTARSPLDDKQEALKQVALEKKLNGKAYGKTARARSPRASTSSSTREGEGAIWTVLGEFADFPHNSIAEPDRTVDNTHHLGAGLQPGLLHGPAVRRRARARTRCATSTSSSPRPLHRVRRRDRLGARCPATHAYYDDSSRTTSTNVWHVPRGLGQRLVRRPDRRRQDPGRDRRVPGAVRRLGPLRLRRRRQLRRARRLHRHLPVGARR